MVLPRTTERELRYAAEVSVELGLGRRTLSVITDNVSASGLFVRSDICGDLRQFVRLQVEAPDDLERFSANGMIVHLVPPGTGGSVPGMGIALYGLDARLRARWAAFIRKIAARAPRTEPRAMLAYKVDGQPPEPIRRRFERFEVVLEVQVMLVDDLVTMYTRDISRGGMLLQTECELLVDDGLVLRIVHPRTRDTLSVPCRVVRVVRDAQLRGVGVEFLDLDEGARAIFWAFVGAELAQVEDEEVILVDESE